MRVVIQRCQKAVCEVKEKVIASINRGMVIFLGVGKDDDLKDVRYLIEKILHLRIFEDQKGKMNLSLLEQDSEILLIPQFTLYADCRRGRRPNFAEAAVSQKAEELYLAFLDLVRDKMSAAKGGCFGASMKITVENDGPVTIILDSDKKNI